VNRDERRETELLVVTDFLVLCSLCGGSSTTSCLKIQSEKNSLKINFILSHCEKVLKKIIKRNAGEKKQLNK
jgi:hypothetical protein